MAAALNFASHLNVQQGLDKVAAHIYMHSITSFTFVCTCPFVALHYVVPSKHVVGDVNLEAMECRRTTGSGCVDLSLR